MEHSKALPAAGAATVVALGAYAWWRRRRAAGLPGSVEPEEGGIDEAPPPAVVVPVPDFGGPLGAELQRAKDNGWDVLFTTSEKAHGIPLGILAAIASQETHTKNIVGDEDPPGSGHFHGRGLMQIDDRSHGAWLKAHGAGDTGTPDVAAAIDYAAGLVASALAYGKAHGVAQSDLLKYALSAYNAGEGGALVGYKDHNDSDYKTTRKNYGAQVLKWWAEMFPAQGEPQIAGWIIGATEPAPAALAPALRALLDQINTLWPMRSTASDGTIPGSEEPDHAAGNAVDITADASNGPDLNQLAEVLLSDPRTHYVIWNARIADRDIQAGAWHDYPEREPNESNAEYARRASAFNRHTRHLHLSIRQSARADASPWPKGNPGAIASAEPTHPAPPVTSDDRLPALLQKGILGAWREGLVDNFRWVPITIGPYEIEVTADAASVHGLRLPASFADVLEMAGGVRDILPPTREIVDARWKNAANKMVIPPIAGGAKLADGSDPGGTAQVAQWDAKLGPVSDGALYDGPWKEWILEPGIQQGHAVNYGLRKDASGAVWQTPGHGHDEKWKDYSQLATFVKRDAKKSGQPVDLLDEIAKGGALGGPLPQWVVDRLNGGSAA